MNDTTTTEQTPIHEVEGFSVLGMASAPEPTPEERREAAFHATYNWKGKAFEGVSLGKKMVWRCLCQKLGHPKMEDCADDVGAFTPSAFALIFICATDWREVKRLRSLGIDAVVSAFDAWTESNCAVSDEKDGLTLGLQIINDSVANQVEAIASGGEGKQ